MGFQNPLSKEILKETYYRFKDDPEVQKAIGGNNQVLANELMRKHYKNVTGKSLQLGWNAPRTWKDLAKKVERTEGAIGNFLSGVKTGFTETPAAAVRVGIDILPGELPDPVKRSRGRARIAEAEAFSTKLGTLGAFGGYLGEGVLTSAAVGAATGAGAGSAAAGVGAAPGALGGLAVGGAAGAFRGFKAAQKASKLHKGARGTFQAGQQGFRRGFGTKYAKTTKQLRETPTLKQRIGTYAAEGAIRGGLIGQDLYDAPVTTGVIGAVGQPLIGIPLEKGISKLAGKAAARKTHDWKGGYAKTAQTEAEVDQVMARFNLQGMEKDQVVELQSIVSRAVNKARRENKPEIIERLVNPRSTEDIQEALNEYKIPPASKAEAAEAPPFETKTSPAKAEAPPIEEKAPPSKEAPKKPKEEWTSRQLESGKFITPSRHVVNLWRAEKGLNPLPMRGRHPEWTKVYEDNTRKIYPKSMWDLYDRDFQEGQARVAQASPALGRAPQAPPSTPQAPPSTPVEPPPTAAPEVEALPQQPQVSAQTVSEPIEPPPAVQAEAPSPRTQPLLEEQPKRPTDAEIVQAKRIDIETEIEALKKRGEEIRINRWELTNQEKTLERLPIEGINTFKSGISNLWKRLLSRQETLSKRVFQTEKDKAVRIENQTEQAAFKREIGKLVHSNTWAAIGKLNSMQIPVETQARAALKMVDDLEEFFWSPGAIRSEEDLNALWIIQNKWETDLDKMLKASPEEAEKIVVEEFAPEFDLITPNQISDYETLTLHLQSRQEEAVSALDTFRNIRRNFKFQKTALSADAERLMQQKKEYFTKTKKELAAISNQIKENYWKLSKLKTNESEKIDPPKNGLRFLYPSHTQKKAFVPARYGDRYQRTPAGELYDKKTNSIVYEKDEGGIGDEFAGKDEFFTADNAIASETRPGKLILKARQSMERLVDTTFSRLDLAMRRQQAWTTHRKEIHGGSPGVENIRETLTDISDNLLDIEWKQSKFNQLIEAKNKETRYINDAIKRYGNKPFSEILEELEFQVRHADIPEETVELKKELPLGERSLASWQETEGIMPSLGERMLREFNSSSLPEEQTQSLSIEQQFLGMKSALIGNDEAVEVKNMLTMHEDVGLIKELQKRYGLNTSATLSHGKEALENQFKEQSAPIRRDLKIAGEILQEEQSFLTRADPMNLVSAYAKKNPKANLSEVTGEDLLKFIQDDIRHYETELKTHMTKIEKVLRDPALIEANKKTVDEYHEKVGLKTEEAWDHLLRFLEQPDAAPHDVPVYRNVNSPSRTRNSLRKLYSYFGEEPNLARFKEAGIDEFYKMHLYGQVLPKETLDFLATEGEGWFPWTLGKVMGDRE